MKLRPSRILIALVVVQLLVFSGCTSPRIEHTVRDMPIGTAYEPENVYAKEQLPNDLYRVAVFPLLGVDGEFAPPEIMDAMIKSLRSKARFEIVMIGVEEFDRASPSGIPSISRSEALAPSLLSVANRVGADGVLQLELNHYRPYKPLQIGVRGRLVHLNEAGDILWSVDEVFDAGDKTVAIAARKYAEEQVEQPFPLQSSFSVLMSPSRFAAYVGSAIFETLPVR